MKVLECKRDLLCKFSGHVHRNRLKRAPLQHLLKVASFHSLHYDAVQVFVLEVLLEAHYVWAVLATGLQGDFAVDLCKSIFIHAVSRYELHSKLLVGKFVLDKHHLASAALTKNLPYRVLVNLIIKALLAQKHSQALLLALLAIKVEKARAVWHCVQLNGIENLRAHSNLGSFFGCFLWLRQSHMASV